MTSQLIKRGVPLVASGFARQAPQIVRPAAIRMFSDMGGGGGDSITYSGGQATTGQGGFYGAGGARAHGHKVTQHRLEAVAHAEDIKKLRALMSEVYELEQELQAAGDDMSKKIQVKATIKKKVASRDMNDLLKSLELRGEPVWGLSTKERQLVKEARKKLNAC